MPPIPVVFCEPPSGRFHLQAVLFCHGCGNIVPTKETVRLPAGAYCFECLCKWRGRAKY